MGALLKAFESMASVGIESTWDAGAHDLVELAAVTWRAPTNDEIADDCEARRFFGNDARLYGRRDGGRYVYVLKGACVNETAMFLEDSTLERLMVRVLRDWAHDCPDYLTRFLFWTAKCHFDEAEVAEIERRLHADSEAELAKAAPASAWEG